MYLNYQIKTFLKCFLFRYSVFLIGVIKGGQLNHCV